jgi:hypothetical protein
MIEHVLHPRMTENKDWSPFYLFLPLRLLLSQSLFMKIVLRFYKLIFQINIPKFIATVVKKQFYYFFVRCPNYFSCFFIQLSLSIFGYADKTDGIVHSNLLS